MISDARLDDLIERWTADVGWDVACSTAEAIRELRTYRKLVKEYLDAVDAPISADALARLQRADRTVTALANLRAFIAGEGT